MEVKKRYSQKREAVLTNMKSRYDHPSAAMVYDSIKDEYPSISLGTVYRNLNELADNGQIIRFTNCGKDRFDGHTAPHYHFCCTECGEIYDIFDESATMLEGRVKELMNCEVSAMQIVIRGKCKNCLDK